MGGLGFVHLFAHEFLWLCLFIWTCVEVSLLENYLSWNNVVIARF